MASMMDLGFGEYPIVLSDALLGRATSELYTGINYSQNTATDSYSSKPRRLAPSGEKANNFSLSFPGASDNLSYQGERSPAQDQYILIFDADKEQFVLHRVDSNFDMRRVNSSKSKNVTGSRPQNSQYESSTKHQPTAPPKKILKKAPATIAQPPQRKAEKPKKSTEPDNLPEADEAEEDSDDGLTIEFPGAQSPGYRQRKSSPLYQRQLSEEVSDDEGDVSPERYEEPEQIAEDSRHVSPVPNTSIEMSDEDMELALEAELEQELLKESAENMAEESDESEEE
ncbi:BgTH12-05429 [Blumeria graminis f. sp. triticale]|uniref:BgTH12-05429 n=1 Tax=Blumeria graminis f. sp. triticale TaxID=1689686 RepID=A0A9W4D1E1_BLUGR|nr:BgTH12-05429 [Blumeria graminis f. sp. triticale]